MEKDNKIIKEYKQEILHTINVYLILLFPLVAIWVLAWLHMNIHFRQYDNFWDKYVWEGFAFTPYGYAYIISIVIIEFILFLWLERTEVKNE